MVAFHAWLRTGELCRVQASHFVRHGKAGPILLTLPDTKSGIRRGDLAKSVVLTLCCSLGSSLVSICGQKMLSIFEYIFSRAVHRR